MPDTISERSMWKQSYSSRVVALHRSVSVHLCFTSGAQDMGVEVGADPEVSNANEVIEYRLDCRNVAALFGKHKNAEQPDDRQAESRRHDPAKPLIEQQPICFQLDRQRDGLGLARVKLSPQLGHKRAIGDIMRLDPRLGANPASYKLSRAGSGAFSEDSVRHDHAAEHLTEQNQPINRREIADRRGIANDDHRSPNERIVVRSSSNSATP